MSLIRWQLQQNGFTTTEFVSKIVAYLAEFDDHDDSGWQRISCLMSRTEFLVAFLMCYSADDDVGVNSWVDTLKNVVKDEPHLELLRRVPPGLWRLLHDHLLERQESTTEVAPAVAVDTVWTIARSSNDHLADVNFAEDRVAPVAENEDHGLEERIPRWEKYLECVDPTVGCGTSATKHSSREAR